MRDLHVYRAFHLDQQGHVARAEYIDAEDDETALERLLELTNGHGIELWDRARRVAIAEPNHGMTAR